MWVCSTRISQGTSRYLRRICSSRPISSRICWERVLDASAGAGFSAVFFADLLGLGRNAGLLFPVFFSAVGLEGFSGGSTGFVCGVSAEVSGSKAVSSGSAGFGASAGVSSATPRKSAYILRKPRACVREPNSAYSSASRASSRESRMRVALATCSSGMRLSSRIDFSCEPESSDISPF